MSETRIAPTTTHDDFLSPLLDDSKTKERLHRTRKNLFDFESIHSADVPSYEEKGWLIHRSGKKNTRIKRAKSHDRWLEDRVWCLLHGMGYHLMNGDNFKISFDRADGSTGKKQIDVFAADSETAFVVECKSRQDRGRRSLQKDIQETISLKEYIRNSIYKLYDGRPKPKLIWAYVTNNIIWSEPDVDRAADGGIIIITENELQYFEAFIKHMGPAGKYQILGEFLSGQKVPGLGDIKIPAIRGTIAGESFYSFVVTPRNLLKIAFINHQALNHPDGKPAYQRMLTAPRIRDIGKFIENGGYFPTNILVNFTCKPRWDLISNKDNTDPNIKFGWLTLPTMYRSAWIIDGQHRLYGYSHLSDKFLDQSLFVLAFEEMETRKEANLFITINHKQKSVPKSLLVSLLADLKLGDSDPKTALSALASAVVRAINIDKTSPFFRRFAQHGVPPDSQQNLTISEAVNGLNASELLGKISHKAAVRGPLADATDEKTVERARKILNLYFEALRNASPKRWETGKGAYLCYNPGIRAHFMLIAEIVKYLSHKKGFDFDTLPAEKFAEEVLGVAKPVFDFVVNATDEEIKKNFAVKFGSGGPKEYLYRLYTIIHAVFSDFGPDEFLDWTSKTESERVEEAKIFVMQLSEKMVDCVIQTLKRVHGEKNLDSGDPVFWEVGVDNRRVRENAYKKQQDDAPDRRRKKWAYLDIIDLPDIMKQPNNWSHFEHIFNLPMTGAKGKKYYLEWVFKFNDLRKIAAHPSNMRTFTDDDLEFLDWLRSELMPKIDSEL